MCPGIVKLRGCGRCLYNVLDEVLISNVDAITIVRLAANILIKTEYTNVCTEASELDKITVSCNKTINIYKTGTYNSIKYYMVKDIYHRILFKWCGTHKSSVYVHTTNEIKATLELLNKLNNIEKLKIAALTLVKSIERISICNKECTTAVPGKDVSMCTFKLNEKEKIYKFDYKGIMSVICTLLSMFIDCDNGKVFLDLDSVVVRCNSDIMSDQCLKPCDSTLLACRSFCIEYLTGWRSSNFCKYSDVNKVRYLIRIIPTKDTISDIYDICDELA